MTAILAAIGGLMALLNKLWDAFNNSASVQRKVAQMTQEEKDEHNRLIYSAMHGQSVDERKKALDEIRRKTSE